ncbi:MAG: stability determinant [Allosphingosinicella sp.]
MNEQSPIVSEFATPQEAAAHEEWLRAKVAASLADERPSIPHDEVMVEMRAIIERKGRPAEPC